VRRAGAPALARVEQVMGMPVVIEVCDAHVRPQALDRAFSWLSAVDQAFSTYRPDSEISRIRRGELAPAQASFAVRSVLGRCERLRAQTDGYFDARAGGELDPSGLVKGWAIAGVARLLDTAGARRYCINAGGDVLVRGSAPQGGPWLIGIQHPVIREALAAVVALDGGALATSGAYARGGHVLDPHTGRPAVGLLSVSVAGPEVPLADAFATAALAMGSAAEQWCVRRGPYEFMLITEDEEIVATPGFAALRVQ